MSLVIFYVSVAIGVWQRCDQVRRVKQNLLHKPCGRGVLSDRRRLAVAFFAFILACVPPPTHVPWLPAVTRAARLFFEQRHERCDSSTRARHRPPNSRCPNISFPRKGKSIFWRYPAAAPRVPGGFSAVPHQPFCISSLERVVPCTGRGASMTLQLCLCSFDPALAGSGGVIIHVI